jgi:hypothetical protein
VFIHETINLKINKSVSRKKNLPNLQNILCQFDILLIFMVVKCVKMFCFSIFEFFWNKTPRVAMKEGNK